MREMGLNDKDAEDQVYWRRCVLLRPSTNWCTSGRDSTNVTVIVTLFTNVVVTSNAILLDN